MCFHTKLVLAEFLCPFTWSVLCAMSLLWSQRGLEHEMKRVAWPVQDFGGLYGPRFCSSHSWQ